MRTRFPEVAAEAESLNRTSESGRHSRALSSPNYMIAVFDTVLYGGSAGRHLELLHPVWPGLHPPAGEASRAAADRHTQRFAGGRFSAAWLIQEPRNAASLIDYLRGDQTSCFLFVGRWASPSYVRAGQGMWAVFLTDFMSIMSHYLRARAVKGLGHS